MIPAGVVGQVQVTGPALTGSGRRQSCLRIRSAGIPHESVSQMGRFPLDAAVSGCHGVRDGTDDPARLVLAAEPTLRMTPMERPARI